MPIYEYVCRDCGHPFEWLVRSGEKPSCPACGRSKLTKQLSVPSAHMAGASEAPCPAKEEGTCSQPTCCRDRCGMGDWS